MLTPLSLPEAPEAAAELANALAGFEPQGASENGLRPGVSPSRGAALASFRRHLARVQASIRDEFEQRRLGGVAAARRLAALTDTLVTSLYEYVIKAGGPSAGERLEEPIALLATGGYGRGVLAPFSDIDILFLTRAEPSEALRGVVEKTLYLLWDLGLQVGHATRSVEECLTAAAGDITIRTALLDARYLAGDRSLAAEFTGRYRTALREWGIGEFIAAKQQERAARHARYGDSPFLVEPNIKEGRGGLRDLQTLHWMARAVLGTTSIAELVTSERPDGLFTEREARLARRSWNFLWSLRFHLHYVAGRAEERLTFDLQPVVGARMGYTRHRRQNGVERFMRHYFLIAREVVRLTRVLEPGLVREASGSAAVVRTAERSLAAAGFTLADNQLLPLKGRDFESEPLQMLRILQVARDRGLELHPLAVRGLIRNDRAARRLRDDPRAAALFMDLLVGPTHTHSRRDDHRAEGARWLAVLNETGFLGCFLPDWGRIVGQMQFDTYHIYTVDEHTIEAIRVLDELERGELGEIAPVATGLVEHLQSRRALYVATLLHDIAKGRGGDHSEIGAEIALRVGPLLGLSAEEAEMVSWLVLHHLLLSQTAFKRDIEDPKTILDLVATVQSPERLRLLLVLTVADMRAVSPKVWNGWKATLLRELYGRVAEVLEGGLATTERDTRVARAKQAAAELLAEWPREAVEAFLALGYPGYWLSFDPETHARHARIVREATSRGMQLVVETQPMPERAVTEVIVYTADHPGLFSRIAGALSVAGASIVDARIHTLTNGMALDTFWIQDATAGSFDAPHRLARLSVLIEQALSGRLRFADEIRKISKSVLGSRIRAIHVPPRVVVDNRASHTHTVIEVNGRDRPGLLHDVTSAISAEGLQIGSAHVTTYGVRAVDVFYVKDVFGLKVENERRIARLREALLRALEPPAEAAEAPGSSARQRAGIAGG